MSKFPHSASDRGTTLLRRAVISGVSVAALLAGCSQDAISPYPLAAPGGTPQADVNVNDPRVMLPEKQEVYNTIEGTIQHFKLVMEGAKVPKGEVYSYTEGGNGELGFYLVSDGSGTPHRVRIRPPCFTITTALKQMIEGGMLSDIIPTFGSLNMIGGECDR